MRVKKRRAKSQLVKESDPFLVLVELTYFKNCEWNSNPCGLIVLFN